MSETVRWQCVTVGCARCRRDPVYLPADHAERCGGCGGPLERTGELFTECPNVACGQPHDPPRGLGWPCPSCRLTPAEVRVMFAEGGPGIPPAADWGPDGPRPVSPLASGRPICPTGPDAQSGKSNGSSAATVRLGDRAAGAARSTAERRAHAPAPDAWAEAAQRAEPDRKRGEHHETETSADALADPVRRHLEVMRAVDDVHDRGVDIQSAVVVTGEHLVAAIDRLGEITVTWSDAIVGELRDGLGTGLPRADRPGNYPSYLEGIEEALARAERQRRGDLGLTAARCALIALTAAVIVALVVGGVWVADALGLGTP